LLRNSYIAFGPKASEHLQLDRREPWSVVFSQQNSWR